MNVYEKQPGDTLDYDADFTNWLPEGDIITSATATVTSVNQAAIDDPDNSLVVIAYAVSDDGRMVKVWVEKGVDGGTYKITATAATEGGRIKETDFRIRVKEQ